MDQSNIFGKKRLDYYDDFTPYIKFAELNNEVIVKFHKNI